MSRLIELTEKALSKGLSDDENIEFEQLWRSQADGFNEAVELLETEALLNGMLFDSNVEKAVFEEILSKDSDRAANNVMNAIRKKNKQASPDFNSIRRSEKAGYYPVIFTIAALIAICFIIFSGVKNIDRNSVASIQKTEGKITIKRQGKESHIEVNSVLQSGDEIKTEEGAYVDVNLEDGTGLEIEESTSLAVSKKSDSWELTLNKGTVRTSVSPQKKSFKMKTPALEVEVVGTAFAVTHINGISSVSVFEGKVKTTSVLTGKTVTLTAGHSFSADSKKIHLDTSKEKIIFAEDFESGKIDPRLSYVVPVLAKNAPWGNNSRYTVSSLVSTHQQPKKYEVRGPLWEDNKNGLLKYKKGMKLKFKYWLNENSFWLGVWMRSNQPNKNYYKSLPNPAVRRWAEATVDLSELTSKVDDSILKDGYLINRLNIQTNPSEKAVLYIDDVRIVEE